MSRKVIWAYIDRTDECSTMLGLMADRRRWICRRLWNEATTTRLGLAWLEDEGKLDASFRFIVSPCVVH